MRGGMEKHIYYLSKYQNEDDDITVFYNQGNSISLNDKKIFPLIKLYKIKPAFLGIFMFYIGIVFKLIIKKNKFDVIHIHGDWSSLVFVSLLKKITEAKLIIYNNHDIITDSFQHRKLLPKGLEKVDLILTTGYESSRIIQQRIINKKIVVQPSGINDVFFNESDKKTNSTKFKVVTVANLLPKKNINLVVEIANKLPNIEFVIVGKGSEKEVIQKKITDNNLLNIKLLGFKTPEEIKNIYDESDCFLLTSLAEGTPTAILEALATGLPVIASNAGGISDIIIDGVNGFIVNNYDEKNYIEKLQLLKDNISLREIIYKNNKIIAEDFRWHKVADRITSLTKKCLNEKN